MSSPNADMRSPIDEECWFEDHRRATPQAELDARLAAFLTERGHPLPDDLHRRVCVERSRRGLNASFEVAA